MLGHKAAFVLLGFVFKVAKTERSRNALIWQQFRPRRVGGSYDSHRDFYLASPRADALL